MSREVRVTFQPSGRSVYVLPGTILIEAAARAGFVIETPCGGAGTCGKCLVKVVSGKCAECTGAEGCLSDEQLADGYRLACQCRVEDEVAVEIPELSLFQAAQKILISDTGEKLEVDPAVRKKFIAIPTLKHGDARSDLELLVEALGEGKPSVAALRQLPGALREDDFKVTATLCDDRIIQVQPGDTSHERYGIAFDIGTTTIVATVVDLNNGADLAVSSMMNPQTSFGDDVLSRIKKCREDTRGLEILQNTLVDAANKLVATAAHEAGIAAADIYMAVFAGNTTMQQVLCGVDPQALGELPFTPAFKQMMDLSAGDIGLMIYPGARVVVFPQIGGFVGGDTVAGIISTRLDQQSDPAVLVDVGTNGEIVLSHDGKLTATSVAAGPAFEGARIVNGMRAMQGAIEKVVFNSDIEFNVIGNMKPAGICGTGLIDLTAAMLRAGVLDSTGRILGPEELPPEVPEGIRNRVISDDGQFCFVLADGEASATGSRLCLYQKDIRELQLANGAIRAGIKILLNRAGLTPEDLGSVLLAGAFGNFIRRSNARRIGMLPQVSRSKIRFVGNTASFGAKMVLLSRAESEYAARVVDNTEHIDLSASPDFQMEFAAAMLFPEED